MKKLLRLVALTALIGSTLIVVNPAIASKVPAQHSAPAALTSAGGPCVHDGTNGMQSGVSTSFSSNIKGAFGYIDPSDLSFDNCGDIGVPSASSAWVAVEGQSGGIIQAGIVMCDAITSPTYCSGSTPHYAVAYGGCVVGGTTQDLGVADFGRHLFRLSQALSNGDWYVYIDNVQKKDISGSDPYIWCWDDANTHAAFFGEKWDRGDALGTSTDRTRFDTMKYFNKALNGWYAIGGTACNAEPSSGIGTVTCNHSGDAMSLFTTY